MVPARRSPVAPPHISTFKLATVVRGLRARIEALGGEVRLTVA